jgi:hypothetical protein
MANNFKDSASGFLSFLALTDAEMGNSAAARKGIASSMTLSHTRSNLPTLAVALALIGESSQARSLIDELKRRYPSDFQVNTAVGPVAMALLQSAQGNSSAAIQTLSTASRAELGVGWGFLPSLAMSAASFTFAIGRERKQPPNSNAFSNTATWLSVILTSRWPTSALLVPAWSRATPRKPAPLTRTSSPSGKTPTPTFPS